MTKTNAATRTDATIARSALHYQSAPNLEQLLLGAAVLSLGHRGDAVRLIQAALNAGGFGPALAVDGMFGPNTQRAVGAFRGRHGLPGELAVVDLLAFLMLRAAFDNRGLSDDFARAPRTGGRRTGPLRAPRYEARAPNGSVSAGQLQRADEERRVARRPLAPTAPAHNQTPADAELASLQSRTIDSARREIGTREVGNNRGQRVDQYARRSRMRVGGAWCGYFTGFNYSEAAREAGGEFNGINGFHSMQKARSFFEYRSFTDNSRSTNARLDNLREQHVAEGSARRWMTLSGSRGQRHAGQRNRPHEVYEPNTLPIRAGDTALFSRGHVGLVEGYDPSTGRLTTIEGNTSRGVTRREYDLNDPQVRAGFEGFGRPARGDFDVASNNTPAATPSSPIGEASNVTVTDAATPTDEVTTTDTEPGVTATLALPPRAEGAETGSAFLERTASMSRRDREAAILEQIEAGNVPSFVRELRPVEVSSGEHTATMFVAPDYLAIGSDDDFVRIPMNPVTAQAIADRAGASLPTARMVDQIYASAETRLAPQPIPPSAHMMSNAYTARHHAMVERQRGDSELGSLTAGHKKDVVITNRLAANPNRVAIYGWHQPNGEPIQPLSTRHVQNYADYSHGVRLVDQRVIVDGVAMRLADALRDPALAPLFSNEGPITDPRAG